MANTTHYSVCSPDLSINLDHDPNRDRAHNRDLATNIIQKTAGLCVNQSTAQMLSRDQTTWPMQTRRIAIVARSGPAPYPRKPKEVGSRVFSRR